MPKLNRKRDKLLWTPADWHSGSHLALTMPSWTWGSGTTVLPSDTQKIIRRQHLENLKLLKKARKDRQLLIAFDGDAVDGNHHGTRQIFSPDENEHSRLFVAVFEEALDYLGFDEKNGDKMWFIMGTESHVGSLEEAIAKYFYDEYGEGAVPPIVKPTAGANYKDGAFIREHLMLDVNGVLFDIAHQPASGPGTRFWTEENGVRSVCKSIYMDRLDKGIRIPNYWVRAHRHKFVPSGPIRKTTACIEGVILPAKQGKTEFGNRVATDHLSDIGDVWWTIDADGYDRMYHNIVQWDSAICNIERA